MNNNNVNEEIINLITVQYDIAKKEISDYSCFTERLIDDGDKDLLNNILIIKTKHLKMLGELYYRLKGEKLKNREEDYPDRENDKYLAGELKRAVLAELENAEAYRSLEADFLNTAIRDVFSEIMTDSQNNALRFSLLLTKYSG